jgi:hypothetical protein
MPTASADINSLGFYLLMGLLASALFAFGLLMMKSRSQHLPTAHGRSTLAAIARWLRDPI